MVSYYSQLLLFFDCYINIEVSTGLETIKYLSKYIYKGSSRTTIEISSRVQNEIKAYLGSQFISPTEAYWKIFEFNIYKELPAIQHFSVYLSNEHYINFHVYQTINKILARQNVEKTQLTAQFDYNSIYNDSLDLIYQQFSQYYIWNTKAKLQYSR